MKKWKKDSRYWGAGEIYREGNPWVDKEMAEEILNIASSLVLLDCYLEENTVGTPNLNSWKHSSMSTHNHLDLYTSMRASDPSADAVV